jgi:carboxyl-terminal processing protease
MKFQFPRLPLLFGFFVLAAPLSAAAEPANRAKEREAVAAQIVDLVRQHFFDPIRAEAWAKKHAGLAAGAKNDEAFFTLTRQALAELKTSHTNYYTRADPEYAGILAIFSGPLGQKNVDHDSIGVDFTPDGFARVVFAGGPGAKAGLHRGDRVLKADGLDFHRVFSIRGRPGKTLVLTVERKKGQPPLEIKVVPRRIDPREEWLAAQREGAATLIRRKDKVIAFMPMFACAGAQYQEALAVAIRVLFQKADALVLDFRNGWGGCNPDFLNLFNPTTPILTSIFREGNTYSPPSPWRKPLFVLINGGTRSGKEVVAYAIQKHRLGTLVGERTAGAVVGGRCFLLPDRSLLFLAVMDVRVDGERLEGRGVVPDVPVADRLPFADGADPQLQKALELAAP